MVLDLWLAAKYIAVAATLLVFLKTTSKVSFPVLSYISDMVLIRADPACMSVRTAAGLPEIRVAGADGGGLLRRLPCATSC